MWENLKLNKVVKLIAIISIVNACATKPRKDYPITPVAFTDVNIEDDFWSSRIETNRTVTIPYDFNKCEETGRINNFAIAGGLMKGEFEGIYFNDSDVFKVIEGASYSLAIHPDPQLEKYLDDLIARIAAAQEDDGYLYTVRSINPEKVPPASGETRWSNLKSSHELYNVGHMYEAAVAYFQSTGKRTLLDVAIKNADLIDKVFGPGKKRDVPGHQEIEIGLVKLYRVTGEKKYLKLAKFFLDERGHARGRTLYGKYSQDHKPVTEQNEAVGHAVRAAYMYSGMADIAALTGDQEYVKAINRIWENVVSKSIYLTGGIGSSRKGEAFGDDYELPNETAYNETCAAIANAMWNHRMFLLHGDAKYLDVLERVLYNGFLSGISMNGNRFFYPNPLTSDGAYQRSPWFDCSCCPVNIVRLIPSIPGLVYAYKDNNVYINLFVASSGRMNIEGNPVTIRQKTRYPWNGTVRVSVHPEKEAEFVILIRIPGWVVEKPIPSDLYQYFQKTDEIITLKVNDKPADLDMENGFTRIRRIWRQGDLIELDIPMPIRRVLSHEKVKDNTGKIALERGPIVYCVEGVDNAGKVNDLVIPDDIFLQADYRRDMLHGVVVIRGKIPAGIYGMESNIRYDKDRDFVAIPYYAWSHREKGEMAVWLLRK